MRFREQRVLFSLMYATPIINKFIHRDVIFGLVAGGINGSFINFWDVILLSDHLSRMSHLGGI